MSSSGATDYTGVTETPGTRITREAARMAVSRYDLVRRKATGKTVLEVACGSGQGLGFVGETARLVVGGDISEPLLATAKRHYRGAVPLMRFDAHRMPFAGGSFDIVQIHEAIYYMPNPRDVFEECRRVLRPAGVLVVSTINPEWADFNPSPFATSYLTARELERLLGGIFNSVQVLFGFPVRATGSAAGLVSALKRTAVKLRLIPRTMRGKTLLKRLFLGPLRPVPPQWSDAIAGAERPVVAPIAEASGYRIIYAIAKL